MMNDVLQTAPGIAVLSDAEIDDVSGAGLMYYIGLAVGYSLASASSFYSELPSGAAIL